MHIPDLYADVELQMLKKRVQALEQELAKPEQDQLAHDQITFGMSVSLGGERVDPMSVYKESEQDRESDRKRFPDETFNRWLDEGISDSGHTVWDTIDNIYDAWAAWESRSFYDKPEQEPVAWQNLELPMEFYEYEHLDPMWHHHYRPLYTAPPRKEWVGLTEHEIWECQKPGLADDVYKLIEAKLKELNT
jgi:hypothetical protein